MTGADLLLAADRLGMTPEWIRVVIGRALISSAYDGMPDHILAAKFVEVHNAYLETKEIEKRNQ